MIYTISFTITCLLVKFTQKIKDRKVNIISLTLSLLIVLLLAGFRSFSVGTDTNGYLQQLYLAAKGSRNYVEYMNSSWWNVWHYISVNHYEYGFSFVVYITTKIFNVPFAPLFTIHLIMYIPLIYILNKERFNMSSCIFVLTYLLLEYNVSLNLLRQFDAISLFILSIYFFVKNKKMKSIFWFLISLLFHTSVILPYFIIIGSYRFINYKFLFLPSPKTKYKRQKTLFIIFCISLIFILYKPIISVLNLINFEFVGYIGNGFSINPKMVILRLPILIYLLIFRKEVKGKHFDFYFFLIILALDFTFTNFTESSVYAGRISHYFNVFYPFMFGITTNNLRYTKSVKKDINLLFSIIYCASYFTYYILIGNANETLPYIFM